MIIFNFFFAFMYLTSQTNNMFIYWAHYIMKLFVCLTSSSLLVWQDLTSFLQHTLKCTLYLDRLQYFYVVQKIKFLEFCSIPLIERMPLYFDLFAIAVSTSCGI